MDDMPPSITKFFDLRNRGDDTKKDLRIKSLRPTPEEAVKFIEEYNTGFDEIKENYWKEMKFLPGDKLFGCNAGEHQITMDAYGNIQPCLAMRSPALNQPKGTSLKYAMEAFKK